MMPHYEVTLSGSQAIYLIACSFCAGIFAGAAIMVLAR